METTLYDILKTGHWGERFDLRAIKVILKDNQSVIYNFNKNELTFEERFPEAYVTLDEHKKVLNENAWLRACDRATGSVLKDRNDAVEKLKEENKMLQANIHDVQKMNEDLHKQLVIEQSLRRISESTYGLVHGTGKGKPIGITNDPELANEKKSTVCKWGPYKVKITDHSSDGFGCKIDLKNEEGECWMALFNKFLEKEKRDQAPIKFGVPKIQKVMFRDPATIVFWRDGTKTVVKAHNEQYDPEKGLAMAISKKALGNDHGYYKTFQKWSGKRIEFEKWVKETGEYSMGGYVFDPEDMPTRLKDMDISSMYAVVKKKEKEEEE